MCYSLKVGSFSSGSPVSDYAVSKPVFDIKETEDNANIYIPMFYVSGKNILSFGSLDATA